VKDNVATETLGTLHSVDQAADILCRSHWTVRWRARHGLMNPVRLGRRLFFQTEELLRVLEEERKKTGK
jgi:hypothetical protein